MVWSIVFLVLAGALANIQLVSTETKYTRTQVNLFDPVLSSNSYSGHIKENERIVRVEPRLYATDSDPSNSLNGKICGYELSLYKHDDLSNSLSQNIPFTVEYINGEYVIKLKTNVDSLDCETKQTHRLYIRAYDCAPEENRRYSESCLSKWILTDYQSKKASNHRTAKSSLTITVEDINEYAPVFTHNKYLFKLHEDQTCDSSSCRVEATDDDCRNPDHRVCGYEIVTKNVPFSIDSNGVISITQSLNNDHYEFDVIAIDCYPASDNTRKISQPARVLFQIIKYCKPTINDASTNRLNVQSDMVHLFDTVNVNTCDETCHIEDIVGTIELNSTGLNSGCDLNECSTVDHEYVLLQKSPNIQNRIPQTNKFSFNGYNQALIVNQSDFSGHFNNEFIMEMWMKHVNDRNNDVNDKEHIFCKSDEKLKNRHHTALYIQNEYLKLLIRKGPLSFNEQTMYASEWIWKISEINDNQWHSYRIIVNYPTKVDLYIDDKLFIQTKDSFRIVQDHSLSVIEGTGETILALGACWHARAARFVQHFHGQLSGLTIKQNVELQRSADCIQKCHQYLDIIDIQQKPGIEFTSNSNRSMWIVRTDSAESYRNLLKHVVYRNTFLPLGPDGERTVTIRTRAKCLEDVNSYNLATFTKTISIETTKAPVQIELKADTNYLVPEDVMNQGIYLFRKLHIFISTIKKTQNDISQCTVSTVPALSNSEQLVVPHVEFLRKEFSKRGVIISGIDSIDNYQSILQQIAYISRTPVAYVDRTFTLSCVNLQDQVSSNEIHVRVRIEKQIVPAAPVAAALSNQFVVNNDHIRDNFVDNNQAKVLTKQNVSDWPVAVIICVSIGLAGVLVLYLITRVRSTNRQHSPSANIGDDIHSQMEWEDDIGLNITVNPLDETRKPADSMKSPTSNEVLNEYSGTSSDEDDDEVDENDGQNPNAYSSEDGDDYEDNRKTPRKLDHQLEWDDAAIEYGPKKV